MLLKNDKLQGTNSYERSLLEEIKAQEHASHEGVLLQSGDQSILVHTALLKNISNFLSYLLSANCSCQPTVIILPSSQPSTLLSVKELLYTGTISSLSRYEVQQVLILTTELGILATSEEIEQDVELFEANILNKSVEFTGDVNDSYFPWDINETDEESVESVECGEQLQIETLMSNQNRENFKLTFPKSRSRRQTSHLKVRKKLSGFKGRLQEEYNKHPVGKYMGPYDMNKNLKLKIRLSDSTLDFKSYTEFYHDGDDCYEYMLKRYEHYDDLDKIKAYRIRSKFEDFKEDSSTSDEVDEGNEGDVKTYTCRPPFSLGTQGHCPQVISILAGDFLEILCIFMLFGGFQFIYSI